MSSFGEIVEPGSRAAWEDWDEITAERNFTELKWKQNIETVEDIDTFTIMEGKYLADCIKLQALNLEPINSIPEVNLQLFRSRTAKKFFICAIKNYNLLLSSEIVELLRKYLDVSKNVIAIQTKALAEYQAMEVFSADCIIRIVSTTKSLSMDLDLKFPKLEQPNMVSGICAGVISLREHLNEAAIAIVCYIEHPEEYQIEEMEKLLEKLSISQNLKTRPSTVLNSNLYI